MTRYPKLQFKDKKNIIIYSNDKCKKKKEILTHISKNLPDFDLIKIENIVFDYFIYLATVAKFSITFGEGFDGYFSQPILLGGISFAVYNDMFFPFKSYKNFENVFENYDEMLANITETVNKFNTDSKLYDNTSKQIAGEIEKLYQKQDYLNSIKKFYKSKFDFYPRKKMRKL